MVILRSLKGWTGPREVGAGIGASHQTGWDGVVAGPIEIFGKLDAQTFRQGGREATFGRENERV